MENDLVEDALLDARAYISKVIGGFGDVQMDGHETLDRIEDALALNDAQRADGWQDIADAPELERVRVAGWQPRSGTCQGYWWHHEDVICDGKAVDHPEATLWMPIHVPTFPTPPGGDHA